MGMGSFAAVAQGSHNEPRLIVLRYEPPGARDDLVLGLVGKAITFDTGGISLKTADYMEDMKGDMSGGGAVIEGMGAIAELGIPLRVLAVVASAENMAGGARLPARRHPHCDERQDDRDHQHRLRRGGSSSPTPSGTRVSRAPPISSTWPPSPARWCWRWATSTPASMRTTTPGATRWSRPPTPAATTSGRSRCTAATAGT